MNTIYDPNTQCYVELPEQGSVSLGRSKKESYIPVFIHEDRNEKKSSEILKTFNPRFAKALEQLTRTVSRKHAKIDTGEDGRASITDLDSTFGTRIQRGRRAHFLRNGENYELEDKDRILLGEYPLLFLTSSIDRDSLAPVKGEFEIASLNYK